jgi:hypothetical protein
MQTQPLAWAGPLELPSHCVTHSYKRSHTVSMLVDVHGVKQAHKPDVKATLGTPAGQQEVQYTHFCRGTLNRTSSKRLGAV